MAYQDRGLWYGKPLKRHQHTTQDSSQCRVSTLNRRMECTQTEKYWEKINDSMAFVTWFISPPVIWFSVTCHPGVRVLSIEWHSGLGVVTVLMSCGNPGTGSYWETISMFLQAQISNHQAVFTLNLHFHCCPVGGEVTDTVCKLNNIDMLTLSTDTSCLFKKQINVSIFVGKLFIVHLDRYSL